MPPRPNDPSEFNDALARIAEAYALAGEAEAADRVNEAGENMDTAGYRSGPLGAEARQHVGGILEELGRLAVAPSVETDLAYALGWIRRLDQLHRELSAKGHLRRRPSRDIRER